MKAEFLLSDEFAEFSVKISDIHKQKKDFETEFKKVFSEHKARCKALDEDALQLQQEFDNWVVEKTKDKS